jgi:glycosyltransferase involved in cell wall biosynthesis
MTTHGLVSIVVPLYNEQETVPALVQAVYASMAGGAPWELVLVDDGSTDETVGVAERLCHGEDGPIRLIRLARNYGQTTAMQAGFDAARGDVVVSMDGDLQNDPADIPRLVTKLNEGYDLVAGYRVRRKDRLLTRKVPSWVANRLIQWATGVTIRDNGCSLKAYRRELLERMRLYSEMHRFIPAVAAGTAGARIAELPVRHHPRRFGTSKYGLSRIAAVLADLLLIVMVRSFRERPLAMFTVGAIMAITAGGVVAVGGIVVAMLEPYLATSFVLPGVALMLAGLSFYLLMVGLIAELVLRNGEQHTWAGGLMLWK